MDNLKTLLKKFIKDLKKEGKKFEKEMRPIRKLIKSKKKLKGQECKD